MKGLKALLTKDILLVLATAFLYNASTQLITPTFPLYVAQLGGEERIVGVGRLRAHRRSHAAALGM